MIISKKSISLQEQPDPEEDDKEEEESDWDKDTEKDFEPPDDMTESREITEPGEKPEYTHKRN